MSKVVEKNRKKINELTDYQLQILIENQRKKMKEFRRDTITLAVEKNKLLCFEKELERRNLSKKKDTQY